MVGCHRWHIISQRSLLDAARKLAEDIRGNSQGSSSSSSSSSSKSKPKLPAELQGLSEQELNAALVADNLLKGPAAAARFIGLYHPAKSAEAGAGHRASV